MRSYAIFKKKKKKRPLGFLIGPMSWAEKKKSQAKTRERESTSSRLYSTWIITSSFLSRGRGGQVGACVGVLAVSRRNEGVARSIDWACLLPSFFSLSLPNVLSYTRTYPPRALVSVRGQSRVALLGTTITNETRREEEKKKQKTTAIVCSSPPAPHTLRVAIGTLVGRKLVAVTKVSNRLGNSGRWMFGHRKVVSSLILYHFFPPSQSGTSLELSNGLTVIPLCTCLCKKSVMQHHRAIDWRKCKKRARVRFVWIAWNAFPRRRQTHTHTNKIKKWNEIK